MCKKGNCERHGFWNYDGGYCLPHLRERLNPKKRKSRKKKIDAVEVLTTDSTEEVQERNEENE